MILQLVKGQRQFKPSASESRAFALFHSANSYSAYEVPGCRPGPELEKAFTGPQWKEEKNDGVGGFS